MASGSAMIRDTGTTLWTNWHESVTQSVRRVLDIWNGEPGHSTVENYNHTTKCIQRLIQDSLDRGEQLRAFGGAWSWMPVAAASGTLLNTKPLNYRFQIPARRMHDDCRIRPENLLFVQCGTSIADLNRQLESRRKSLSTSGASNGQTIAGALSTGTHGSAYRFGAMPEMVRALHVIVSPNASIWIEPKSNRIVQDSLPGMLNATLEDNEEVFRAALVSLGSFGIIHGVVIEIEDLYKLQVYWKKTCIEPELWATGQTLDRGLSDAFLHSAFKDSDLPDQTPRFPYHFDMLIDPFDSEGHAYVRAMYKLCKCDASNVRSGLPSRGQIQAGDGLPEIFAAMNDAFPSLSALGSGIMASIEFEELNGACGTHGQVFTDTTTRGKTASTAIGVHPKDFERATRVILEAIRRGKATCLFAARFVGPTRAFLGFTNQSPYTCVLEVDGPRSDRLEGVYCDIWRALECAGVPHTFHWGKFNNLDGRSVRQRFGNRNVAAWIRARRKLLATSELRAAFSNELLRKLELNE